MANELRKPIARSTHTRAGTLCPSRAPAATPPYCRKGGVYSGGGREQRGRAKSRRREDGRLGHRVRPRQQDGATRNTRGSSGRTCSRDREGTEGNPPTSSVSLVRADFGGINGRSRSSSSNDSRTSSDSSNSINNNDSGDLPALVERPARDLEVFGKLLALQSGRTRFQSRGLTIGASYADDLLVYPMRAVEVKKITEEKVTEIERAHGSLLEERLEKKREWLEELERRGALLDWRYCLTLMELKLWDHLCAG